MFCVFMLLVCANDTVIFSQHLKCVMWKLIVILLPNLIFSCAFGIHIHTAVEVTVVVRLTLYFNPLLVILILFGIFSIRNYIDFNLL